MHLETKLLQLNKFQLNWLAKLLTDIEKGIFLVGVVGFFVPSLDVPVTPIMFLAALWFSLTTFFLAGKILGRINS